LSSDPTIGIADICRMNLGSRLESQDCRVFETS
jgi:hypothetical protein